MRESCRIRSTARCARAANTTGNYAGNWTAKLWSVNDLYNAHSPVIDVSLATRRVGIAVPGPFVSTRFQSIADGVDAAIYECGSRGYVAFFAGIAIQRDVAGRGFCLFSDLRIFNWWNGRLIVVKPDNVVHGSEFRSQSRNPEISSGSSAANDWLRAAGLLHYVR